MTSHHGPVVDRMEAYTVIDCAACGYRHVAPLPGDEEIERWYREHHYSDPARDRIDYYERDRDWWLIAFGDVFAEIDRVRRTAGRRVMDVGCGTGIFLEAAREQGWEGVGVEPSAAAADHCRKKGLQVIEAPFRLSSAASGAPFDVVHMRNVLEHVADPAEMLRAAKEILVRGGLLVAAVPNDYNPLQRALRQAGGYRPWWLAPPHHLNYFDFDSLEGLLARCGYEVAGRYCSFPLELFLAMGDNYVEDSALGRACHLKRVRFDKMLQAASQGETRRSFYRAIAAAGIGREAVVMARRP